MLGYRAIAICAMITNRDTGEITKDYMPVKDKLISFTAERLFRNYSIRNGSERITGDD